MQPSLCNQVFSKLDPDVLQQKAIHQNEGQLDHQDVLTVTTGNRTGRSPKDRFIIEDNLTHNTVDWGKINQPFSPEHFNLIWQKALTYLDNNEHYHNQYHIGHDLKYAVSVEVYTELAWHQLFAHNMFNASETWPVNEQPTWSLINCPSLFLDPEEDPIPQLK